MSEANVKAVALFFFYAFLDESLARLAATNVISRFRKYQKKSGELNSDEARIVYWTFRYWKRYRKRESPYNILSDRGWNIPSGLTLDSWKRFKRESSSEEFLAVIWSRVLNFNDEQIADGLGQTTGTIRHRIGRGLRTLGNAEKQGGPLAET